MSEGFVLLKSERPRLIGFINLRPIYVFYMRPTALQKSLIHGKKQWKSETFFSHGSSHSKGTMILVKDFKLISFKTDSLGRYIFLEAQISDSSFFPLNIYAPNKCAEQCVFFSNLTEDVKDFVTDADKSIIVGGAGDLNVIFDQDLGGRGGNKKRKDSVRYVEDMIIEHD